MKFIHISDLHIGKRLNEYSLIKDQEYILGEIIRIIKEEAPDVVLVAGDVYDKSMPSAEAVGVLDNFLAELASLSAKTFIISGNHDSAERIAYGEKVFKKNGIYLSPVFDGTIKKETVEDEWGKVNIYLMPFVKPHHVKKFSEEVQTYTDAVGWITDSLHIDENERNVILSHQFVTGAERSDSEEVAVGGLDNVESTVYEKFDYVALGHIHKCQRIKDNIYYSGTPLKYSASESGHEKCVIAGELKEKGNLDVRRIPLVPMRDYVDIKGKLEDVLKKANEKDFARITLTDEEALIDAYGKVRNAFPNLTELLFERKRKELEARVSFSIEKSPENQFEDFYLSVNNQELTAEQKKTVLEIFREIKEERE